MKSVIFLASLQEFIFNLASKFTGEFRRTNREQATAR